MLTLLNPDGQIYNPGLSESDPHFKLTTHLGIGAHPDDLEIIAIHGILAAYDDPLKYFTGVTVTDGRGAPRSSQFAGMSNDDLWQIRCDEQKKAADHGRYHTQFLLNYPSQALKSLNRKNIIKDLKSIIKATSPLVIYTHNPADKHDTHVGVALCVIQALRELGPAHNPQLFYGCEAWRDLDWLVDEDKTPLDVSNHAELQDALLAIYDSQITGGKRYDLALVGRRQANATFYQSHQTDTATRLVYAMDLTPLLEDPEMEIEHLLSNHIQNFACDVYDRLNRLRMNSV